MNDRKNIFQTLASKFSSRDHKKKLPIFPFMFVFLLLGVAFMIVGSVFSDDAATLEPMNSPNEKEVEPVFKQTSDKNTIEQYEERFESELKGALESINGIGQVEVVVNVDSTSEQVLEKNRVMHNQTTEETDKEGGRRLVEDKSVDEQVVIIRKGEEELPVVTKTEKPKIRGVLIVAEGAESVQVKKMIVDAVTRVLDLDSHQVAVMPKK